MQSNPLRVNFIRSGWGDSTKERRLHHLPIPQTFLWISKWKEKPRSQTCDKNDEHVWITSS